LCRHTPQHWTGKRACSGRKSPLSANVPRCGSPVYEGKKNYIAAIRNVSLPCGRMTAFSRNARPPLPPKIAAALLKSGKANVKKLYSPEKQARPTTELSF